MSLLPHKVNYRTVEAPFCKFIALTLLLFFILMSKQHNKLKKKRNGLQSKTFKFLTEFLHPQITLHISLVNSLLLFCSVLNDLTASIKIHEIILISRKYRNWKNTIFKITIVLILLYVLTH